eukprot:453053-Pleurochrysis_carterae.AAC.1
MERDGRKHTTGVRACTLVRAALGCTGSTGVTAQRCLGFVSLSRGVRVSGGASAGQAMLRETGDRGIATNERSGRRRAAHWRAFATRERTVQEACRRWPAVGV